MEIHHGWNAHFQDDILTVREDDGISIIDWMFVSRFFFYYIMFQMDIHHGWNRYLQDDILTVMEDLNPSKYSTV